jgi:hypothetical protein
VTGASSSCSARAPETLDAPTPNLAAAFGSSPAASGPDHRCRWATREIDAQPGRAPLELSPTHGAGQQRLLNARGTRADPPPACSAGRTNGPLHAVLVTRPPRLLHARRSETRTPPAGARSAAASRRIQWCSNAPLSFGDDISLSVRATPSLAREARTTLARNLQHLSKRSPAARRLPSTRSNVDGPFTGLAAGYCLIAPGATTPSLPLLSIRTTKQKPFLGVEHDPGVSAWVDAEVRRAAVAWPLLLRCSSGAESGATRSFRRVGGCAFGFRSRERAACSTRAAELAAGSMSFGSMCSAESSGERIHR